MLSRAAGAPGGSSPKGGADWEDGANNTSAASGPTARAVGHDAHTGMMILALATRHRVERPAMGMEGGTLNPMERLCPSPFETPLTYDCEPENPHRPTVRILSHYEISPNLGRIEKRCFHGRPYPRTAAKERKKDRRYYIYRDLLLQRNRRHRCRLRSASDRHCNQRAENG